MSASTRTRPPRFDAIIVGAGFAGMYMLHRLRGLGLRAHVFEAGGGVGGTWYWNRYPGARCDVESVEYSYSFDAALQREWNWTERYAAQPEILAYAEHVADRFGLRRDISFDARVETAVLDEATASWQVETTRGRASARFLILAVGCLSSPNRPSLPGLEWFHGPVLHTGQWPHGGAALDGLRVAVIGTGSSAIQAVPVIARSARHLFVLQRTANYAVPAHNRPLQPGELDRIKADYPALRATARSRRNYISFAVNPQSALAVAPEERLDAYESRWATGGLCFNAAFADQLVDRRANAFAAEFVRGKIRAIVRDPETAALLSPQSVIGCKRLCVESGYYEAFNRANVELVDISQRSLEAVTATAIRAAGRELAVDAIVFATGFDAMTGSILRIDPIGKGGRPLSAAWAEGPKSYLGLSVAGFPNLFTITGPGSPSVLSNMIASIEQHVDWIADCLDGLRRAGRERIEPTIEAQENWVRHVGEVAGGTLYPHCNSWYLGANIPGKPRVFMPYVGCPPYRAICDRVAADGYSGFRLS